MWVEINSIYIIWMDLEIILKKYGVTELYVDYVLVYVNYWK
jgi:hypothetical protein